MGTASRQLKSFSRMELVYQKMYLFKGKRFPADFNVQELDHDAIAFMTPEGAMNQQVWDEMVAPWIVSVWPKAGK